MSYSWQRRRAPDEVPTPVAVALSDYCRRAQSPASAAEVREALSALPPDDDFRVRQLTDGEPAVHGLGPFAAVDVLQGTEPALAAQRQACGYYELARALLSASERPSPLEAHAPAAVTSAPLPAPVPAKRRAEPTRAETVAERIAPKKKHPEPPEQGLPEAAPGGLDGPPHKRPLPQPRGRFTRVDMPKASVQELFNPTAHALLEQLLEQHKHRPALLEALQAQYVGRNGEELSLADLDGALQRQGLLEQVVAQERAALLGAYEEHRGANGRVAWALNVRPADLDRWVTRLGMREEVEALRERFRREALATAHWSQRLDLLGRTKYLSDLGIADRFTETLRRDLKGRLDAVRPEAADPADLYARAGKALGVAPELVARACEKLGLSEAVVHPSTP